jgi:hypothetical protein
MANDYLKNRLQINVPMIVEMDKRMAPKEKTDYVTKEPTGKMEYPYAFILPEREIVLHYANEFEEETLSAFNPGDQLQVVRQEKKNAQGREYKIYIWTATEGAEARAASNPPAMTNCQEATAKRNAATLEKEEFEKWLRIDTSKIIFGYMNTEMAKGKSPSDAVKTALEALKLQDDAVNAVVQKKLTSQVS